MNIPTDVPSLSEFYRFSWLLGLRTLLSGAELKMGLARLLNPLSYPRYMEYDLVLRDLQLEPGMRVLDVGSPKLLPLVLASRLDISLWMTDIRDYFIPSTRFFLHLLDCDTDVGNRIHLETQDGRNLTYDDNSFDRIFAVSVVEHIPDLGDSWTMAELARVLKPGGLVSLTVPFASHYAEEMVKQDVYERERHGEELVFFQRRYDDTALESRLVEASGLDVISVRYFGEPILAFEPVWNRIPMLLKLSALWLQPFIAKLLLRELPCEDHDIAVGVALTLRKPSQRD